MGFNVYPRKFLVLLHTLLAYNSLLVNCKAYYSDPEEGVQDEGMVKPLYTLVMIRHHIKRTPDNNKLAIPKYQHLLLGENHTEKKA